jgi:hypothetical protein
VTERRRYPRTTRRLLAFERLGNRRLPRVVSRLGSHGFFVESQGPQAKLGELVVMEFADDEATFRVTGDVVYVQDDGVGVRITRADWKRLSRLLGRSEAV